ncbi:hypothetical protein [Mycobacterium sp.]|uniref:hypothetical protein n=1 Tax=Mycobacterium sp. TaxID=1785 RepID=UPI0025E583F1|nr:hypothetical protein [Mycobacterium sp.]
MPGQPPQRVVEHGSVLLTDLDRGHQHRQRGAGRELVGQLVHDVLQRRSTVGPMVG